MRSLSCLFLLLCAATVSAEDKVYRYVDEKGVVHYTDKPPAKDSKPVNLPKLQTFSGAGIGNAGGASASKKKAEDKIPAMPTFSLAINSPTPDETLRDAARSVGVSVTILPALVSGFGLVYLLDGQAQNEQPLSQTSFTIQNIERGTHEISVNLVDAEGKLVASSSVTVHSKPPVARP